MSIISCPSSIIYCRMSIIYCNLSIIYCNSSIICCLTSIICCHTMCRREVGLFMGSRGGGGQGAPTLGKSQVAIDFLRNISTDPLEKQLDPHVRPSVNTLMTKKISGSPDEFFWIRTCYGLKLLILQ